MVPFDVVIGRRWMISNNTGVTNLSESFEVLSLSVMQSCFGVTNKTVFDFCERLERSS